MNDDRAALATSICSTFDMGHHHHEAFLQPDHCDDGLSDADELLRSLRAQGYSVARSEGPGLDAQSLDEGLLAWAIESHSHVGVPSEVVIGCDRGHVELCSPAIAAEYRRLAQEGETP